MNKTVLINFAIVSSLIGILFLAYFLQKIEIDKPSYLSINGTVLSIRRYPKIAIINLKPDSLQVVSFRNVSFKKGEHVKLKGYLKNYKGRLEFVLK